MKRTIFTVIISLFIAIGSFAQSGTCGAEGDGSNLEWNLDVNGVLTISGSGVMKDYFPFTDVPWYDHINSFNCLVIEEGITHIGSCAFGYCTGFTGSLTIPNSVETMGNYAFMGCSGFTGSLTIGNSVTTIWTSVFQDCTGFTGSLTIGNSLATIGISAFAGCSGLTSIEVDADNQNFSSEDGILYDKAQTQLIQCPCGKTGDLLPFPATVITIGGNAFNGCSGLTGSLTMPNSVKTIGGYAFKDCRGFTGSLTIGDSVETIEQCAFQDCTGFTGSLDIPNSVKTIKSYAFHGCIGFTGSLTISNSVATIGNSAFNGCSGLTGNLTIPNSVGTIEGFAFNNCSSFTGSLTIPNSVGTIGDCAFQNCSGITSIISEAVEPPIATIYTFTGVNKSIPVYIPDNTLRDYQIAEGWKDFTNFIDMGEEVGIKDNTQEIAGVYPNTDGTFTIDVTGSETFNVTVVNIQGQVVKREMIRGGSHIININSQPAGVYMFVVDNGKQKTVVKVKN